MRLSQLTTEADCLLRPTTQLAGINDNGSIRVLYVLQSALGEAAAAFQLVDGISIRNPSEFIQASNRTPTARIDPVFQRNVERSAIDASLSAGNYFHPQPRRL